MTTKHSSLSKLTEQANRIAAHIKAFERGEIPDHQFSQKLRDARANKTAPKIGIVMDDKVITLTIPWETINGTGEVELSAYILKLMREEHAVQ